VIDFLVKEHGSKELITLGAYVTGTPPKDPKVYAAVTDLSLESVVSAGGCEIMNSGAISGMNGLLLGMAHLKGLNGFTLLGETSGYTFEAKAPELVLSCLSKILGIKVNYEKLEERAREAQEVVKALEGARKGQQQLEGSFTEEGQPQPSDKDKLGYIS